MSKAILEGVAFALKDCLEVAKKNGVYPTYSTICGGVRYVEDKYSAVRT